MLFRSRADGLDLLLGAHPRALVAGAVASQRLERGERAAAGAALELAGAGAVQPRWPAATALPLLLGDHPARRR